jgi:hypothetical protein
MMNFEAFDLKSWIANVGVLTTHVKSSRRVKSRSVAFVKAAKVIVAGTAAIATSAMVVSGSVAGQTALFSGIQHADHVALKSSQRNVESEVPTFRFETTSVEVLKNLRQNAGLSASPQTLRLAQAVVDRGTVELSQTPSDWIAQLAVGLAKLTD